MESNHNKITFITLHQSQLKQALTEKIHDSAIYMKGIDASYYYEGYTLYKTEDMAGKK